MRRLSGVSGPAEWARFLLPPHGARRRAHARRLDDHLRGPGAEPQGVPRPHRLEAAPGAALPSEAALRPLRTGPPGLGRRPPPQPRLPRAPHRAAGARRPRSSCATSPRGSSPSSSTAPSRCGSCGWSRGCATAASRSSARATTRSSTASPASTSPPCSSTSIASRRSRRRPPRGSPRPSRPISSCSPTRCASGSPARARSSAASARLCAAHARSSAGLGATGDHRRRDGGPLALPSTSISARTAASPSPSPTSPS